MKKRNKTLELLRFCFAVVVMGLHTLRFRTEGDISPGGRLGVEFFFILSGYLMAVSIQHRCATGGGTADDLGAETWQYLGRKISGFMPELLVSLIIGFFWMEVKWKDAGLHAIASRLLSAFFEPLLITMAGFRGSLMNSIDWYLSAMVLAMLVLYPICRKYFSIAAHVIMPAIAIAVYGYFYRVDGLTGGVTWMVGFVYKGLVRAFAGIALGVSCYPIVMKLKSLEFSKRNKWLITILEAAAWLVVFAYIAKYYKEKWDIICIVPIVAGFCLSATGNSYIEKCLPEKVCYFLGKCSLPIYLGHIYVAHGLESLKLEWPGYLILCVYIASVCVNALCIYSAGGYIRRRWVTWKNSFLN